MSNYNDELTFRALELLDKNPYDHAALLAHDLYPDHEAWNGASQKAREGVYNKTQRLLNVMKFKGLISLSPYEPTSAGHDWLLAVREQRLLLHIPLYTYDKLSDWYDGRPIIYFKDLGMDRQVPRVALYILADYTHDLESFFITSLSIEQGIRLTRKEQDMHTLIGAAERHYLLTYKWSTDERRISIQRLQGDVSKWTPLPGEFFYGNEGNVSSCS